MGQLGAKMSPKPAKRRQTRPRREQEGRIRGQDEAKEANLAAKEANLAGKKALEANLAGFGRWRRMAAGSPRGRGVREA